MTMQKPSSFINFGAPRLVRSSDRFRRLGRHYDLMLVVLIIAVIALMVLPLPPLALDILIAINLTLSVTVLIVSLYIGSPLGLSTFPSLLLFTTLLRLSLNIASTRQILLHAYAGDIILTFGKMVVGGDVIIGMVVFLIIAIVQFIVIAKGSERVAEVAARFSLDAMPGKQMSIDADLRAGIINKDTARQRRQMLESESQLYGAMDGAMKFVKGDAIAGLVIAAVNVIAGVAVGMLRKDMSLDGALQTYSILAVGDALVSQIPSLFVSIAAGVIITRVARHDGVASNPLGNDIAAQIRAHPKALFITGMVVLGLMLVPGFPKLPFLFLGATIALIGWEHMPRRWQDARHLVNTPMPSMQRDGSDSIPVFLDSSDHPLTLPIAIQVYPHIDKHIDPQRLNRQFARVRRYVTIERGIPFPGMVMRPDLRMRNGEFGIYIHELPVLSGKLQPGCVLCVESEVTLAAAGIPVKADGDLLGDRASWVEDEYGAILQAKKLRYLRAEEVLESYLQSALSQYAHEFIGVQESQFLLKRLEQQYPELEKELRQQVPLPRLADILRRLVQEHISIRDLRLIAQTLVEYASREKDNVLLTECVRNTMGRYITYQYTLMDGTLPAIILAPALEESLKQYIKQTSTRSFLLLPEALRESMTTQIGQILQSSPDHSAAAVLLVNAIEIRPHLRAALADKFHGLPVLAVPQLEGTLHVRSLGQVA